MLKYPLDYERIYIKHPEFYGEPMIKRHTYRYQWASNFVHKYERVLDMCCGTGYGTQILARKCHSILGIDKNKTAINYANIHHKNKNTRFEAMDVIGAKLDNALDYNAIVCIEAIEHFKEDDVSKVLRFIHKNLCFGGKLIMTTPDKNQSDGMNKYHLREYDIAEIKKMLGDLFFIKYFKVKDNFIYIVANKNGYN